MAILNPGWTAPKTLREEQHRIPPIAPGFQINVFVINDILTAYELCFQRMKVNLEKQGFKNLITLWSCSSLTSDER